MIQWLIHSYIPPIHSLPIDDKLPQVIFHAGAGFIQEHDFGITVDGTRDADSRQLRRRQQHVVAVLQRRQVALRQLLHVGEKSSVCQSFYVFLLMENATE